WDLRIEAPQLVQQEVTQSTGAERVWHLTFGTGLTGRYSVRLIGRVHRSSPRSVAMPDVHVEGAALLERRVAVVGKDLVWEDPHGLLALPEAATGLRRWPIAAQRLEREGGSAWGVVADDWRLRVRPRSSLSAGGTVQVLLDEQTAALTQGGQW